MDDLTAPFCGECSAVRQVNWSPAFGEWLCAQCRWSRTEHELMMPVTVLPLPRPEGG